MAVGVWVGEKPSLKNPIVGGLDTWDKVSWRKCNLLNLREKIVRVPIKNHFSYWNKREVSVRPNLGYIEDIEAIGLSLGFRHDLDVPSP